MAKQATVEAQCSPCDGSGVYHGFAEPKGVGVVCRQCGGSGKLIIKYTPFTARRRRTDIVTVRLSRGTFIATGVGPAGSEVTYDEFLAGKMPQP